jgi:hypothetical protein
MTSRDDLTTRIEALRRQSRAAGDTFAAEMERITREVAHRDPSVVIGAREGLVSDVVIDREFFGEATASSASGAASAALVVAGIATTPDVSARAHEVMARLARGASAADAIRDTADEHPVEPIVYAFPDLSVIVESVGGLSVRADSEWFADATADDFAVALRERVNDVVARRRSAATESTRGEGVGNE